MLSDRQRQLLAEAALILATFFWGISFVMVKEIILSVPVHWFHTLRFGLGALILWALALAKP